MLCVALVLQEAVGQLEEAKMMLLSLILCLI